MPHRDVCDKIADRVVFASCDGALSLTASKSKSSTSPHTFLLAASALLKQAVRTYVYIHTTILLWEHRILNGRGILPSKGTRTPSYYIHQAAFLKVATAGRDRDTLELWQSWLFSFTNFSDVPLYYDLTRSSPRSKCGNAKSHFERFLLWSTTPEVPSSHCAPWNDTTLQSRALLLIFNYNSMSSPIASRQ